MQSHYTNLVHFYTIIYYTTLHSVIGVPPIAYSLSYALHDNKASTTKPPACYSKSWLSHISRAPESIKIPPEATRISTPLVPKQWHSDRQLTHFFISGITSGFRLGCKTPLQTLKSSHKNLVSSLEHLAVVDEYLANELKESRIAGPFKKGSIPDAHVSRFVVVPKKSSEKWRLIVNLSHPQGSSVNDAIPKELCSLSYITIDTAIKHILTLGPGTLLAKLDIKNSFLLLPADRHLLAMQWNNNM